MIIIDAKDIINILTIDDIIKILGHLGSDLSDKSNDENLIFSTCVCHDGDSYKLYYFQDSKNFHCYSQDGHIGNIFDLVMKSKDIEFKDAVKFVSNIIGNSITLEPKKGFGNRNKQIKNKSILDIKYELLPVIDRPFLHNTFAKVPIKQWIDEGISFESMNKFQIRYNKTENTIIIPHANMNGDIVGIRVRPLNESIAKKYGKYKPLWYNDKGYNHKLSQNLYGLNISKSNIKKNKRCIVFEGEKSVLKMETMYPGANVSVAVCGSSFSKQQKKMLLDLGVKEIVIGFDKQYKENGDAESIEWVNKINKICKDLIDIVKISYIWDTEGLLEYKDSPVDKGKKVFEKLLQNRMKVGD